MRCSPLLLRFVLILVASLVPLVTGLACNPRDARDPVHLRAPSDRGDLFAMRFAQAQGRLWQIELQRHVATVWRNQL